MMQSAVIGQRVSDGETTGGDSTVTIGIVLCVALVAVLAYMNRDAIFGPTTQSPGAPPPPKDCPHQQNCGAECRPTGSNCPKVMNFLAGIDGKGGCELCSQANCCSGGSQGCGILQQPQCKDENDGHYPCLCNGTLMKASGEPSKVQPNGGCNVM